MKQIKKNLFLLLALVLAFTGCSQEKTTETSDQSVQDQASVETEAQGQEGSYPLSLTDGVGREITIEKPVQSLVVTQPADAEILYALGAEDLIIGRGEYVNYPEEALDIPLVGSVESLDMEKIISMEPDILIIDAMDQAEDLLEQADKAGLAYLVTNPNSIEDIYKSIEMLGALTGKNSEAQDLISEMKATFEDYSKKADQAGQGHSIYFEISPLEFGLWTAGEKTFFNKIGQMLNMENIFSDIESWGEISEEEVLSRNPDFIISTTMVGADGKDPAEEIMARPGWDEVSAVKNKNVYSVDNDSFTRPGPRLMEAIATLYGYIYE